MARKTREQLAADKAADAANLGGTPVKENVATVVNSRGNFVRQFDLATHGKDFAENAAEFAEKFGHTVVTPKKLKAAKPEAPADTTAAA